MSILIAIALFSCAVQQPPQGGPRDRTPPKLLKATPVNQTHRFAAKEIVLEFDEFFKLTNQYQEINMSPAQDKPPEYIARQKSLVIKLKDTLLKNTTYVINFGKAIGDVNEGNILKNFTYVFSTGDHIDSLNISGTVINSLTQQREKDVTVMLFNLKQDSLLFGKKKANLFTSTDTSGNFTFSNLKEDDYRIYALKEKSPDRIYNNENELIAFQKENIHLTRDTAGIKLSLFQEIPEKFRLVNKNFDKDGSMFFSFNKPLAKPSVRIIFPANLDADKIVEFKKTRDTVSVYSKNMDFDSIKVAFLDNNKSIDTAILRKSRKESFQRAFALNYNLRSGAALKPGEDLHITSNLPIESFDKSYITLNEDSSMVSYTIQKDTGTTRGLTIKYRWKQKAQYNLTFSESALTSIYGDKNKKIVKKLNLDNQENYSLLALKVKVPDTARSYIVELLNEQQIPIRSDVITKSTSIVYRNIYTGKYGIRVVYDTNRNGKWDTGSVKGKTKPENIWVNSKIITLRPNWEAEEPLDIPKEVVTP